MARSIAALIFSGMLASVATAQPVQFDASQLHASGVLPNLPSAFPDSTSVLPLSGDQLTTIVQQTLDAQVQNPLQDLTQGAGLADSVDDAKVAPVPDNELLFTMPVDPAAMQQMGFIAIPIDTLGSSGVMGSSQFKLGRQSNNNCLSAYPGQRQIFLAGCQQSNSIVELQPCRQYQQGLATQQWAFWSSKGWLVLTNSGNKKCMKAVYESSTPNGVLIENCNENSNQERFRKIGPAFLNY